MKPRPFEYAQATTLEQVLELLAQAEGEVKILAGGQSLVPAMNFGLARPAVLVDINRVPGLAYIEERQGGVAIGATTRHYQVEDSEKIGRRFPLVVDALRHVGHRAIRHRGTVGGSLSHADPAAEWGALAQALEAQFTIRNRQGTRRVGAKEFFLGPMTTCLAPDELLTEVFLPDLSPGARTAFYEVARRHGDFALVGVAAAVVLNETGVCTFARLGLCGVGPTPMRAPTAEQALLGARLTPAALAEVERRVSAEVDPDTDIHGTAEYRRALAGVCARRALALAAGETARLGA